jgi:nuclear pore complex protein Nup188
MSIETLVEISRIQAAAEDAHDETYLHSGRVMQEATRVILNALQSEISAAQPIGLAWSIILQEARERTQHAQESRDHRLEQRAYDSLGQSQLSDSDSNESFPQKSRQSSNRRTSFGSDTSQQQTLLDYNLECVQKVHEQDDVISLIANISLFGTGAFGEMANLAADFCRTFCASRGDGAEPRLRFLLLQVVEAALNHVQYGDHLISTTLVLLTGNRAPQQDAEVQSRVDLDVAGRFLQSHSFMEHVFDEASNRFPYESVPFIELCSALAYAHLPGSTEPFVISFLRELKTFTSKVYEEDTRYDLLEDDPYYIELQSPLYFSAAHGGSDNNQQLALPSNIPFRSPAPKQVLMTLPEGTRGLTLSEQKPMVVRFDFKQPGFAYLGRMVQQAAMTYASSEKRGSEQILEPAARIIELLTRLLLFASAEALGGSKGQLSGHGILEAFSDGLDRNADIVSVILEIFEGELYEQHSLAGGPHTELLAHCTRFLKALLPLQPSRVWPFLNRSSLLGVDGTESRFLGVVASQELPLGRYAFLTSCLHLFEALVGDVVTRAVSKDCVPATVTRFEPLDPPSGSAGIRDAHAAKILYACTRHMVDCFESSGKWKSVAANEDKMIIQDVLCRTMDQMLTYCFDADDSPQLSEKLPGVLSTSVQYLLDVFFSRSKSEIPTDPFVQTLYESLQTPINPLLARIARMAVQQTTSTINLANTLLRLNAYLNQPSCRLEEQLFECAEILARNFAIHDRFRQPIIELLLSMMTGSSRMLEQPPSLLGHLGQQPAKWFLDVLSTLDGPLPDLDYSVTVWKFLSAVVSQRQQWFAIYLLTGQTARTSLRELSRDRKPSSHKKSLLDIAISKLCRIDLLKSPESAAMLEFVALAADFWLWVPERLEENSAFVKELNRVLMELNQQNHNRHSKTEEAQMMDTQIAASIANIFAMVVHKGNETKDVTFAKLISPNLNFFVKAGVSGTSYNLSLHRSLQRNFEVKYPKCRLSNFKRTTLRAVPLGRGFFYDVDLANKMLGFDKAWAREDGKGFLHEFERANFNLSLVQAQIVSPLNKLKS